MLLLQLTLSVFDAVYAFARRVGDRHARLWPAVATDLEHACALLPLMRADVTRRTAPCLVQCDACNDGDPRNACRRKGFTEAGVLAASVANLDK